MVRELQPRYVLLENVSALLSRGLDTVLRELAEIGYAAEWHCIPSAAVGAPHIRDRIFIVAHADSRRCGEMPKRKSLAGSEAGPAVQSLADSGGKLDEAIECIQTRESNIKGSGTDVPHADSNRAEWSEPQLPRESPRIIGCSEAEDVPHATGQGLEGQRPKPQSVQGRKARHPTWSQGETPRSNWWLTEPDVGRVAHGVPKRVDRLKCLGNAVVPQVAELIGRMIVDGDQSRNAEEDRC